MDRNLWETIQQKARGGSALFLFAVGVIAVVLAIILSVEDTKSSYEGLISLQEAFTITLASSNIVLWSMSLAPQVGQIVFIALWSLDTERKWALFVGLFWFFVDFVSDVQYRSNDLLFPKDGGITLTDASVWVAALGTMVFFTIGAELFMVAGTALITMLYPKAKVQWALLRSQNKQADREATDINRSSNRHGNKPQNQQSQQRPPQQPPGQPRGQQVGEITENDLDTFLASVGQRQGREARQAQGRRE